MPQVTLSTVVKLLLWSLAVGAVLAFFDITPQDVLGYVAGWASDAPTERRTIPATEAASASTSSGGRFLIASNRETEEHADSADATGQVGRARAE